MPALSLTQRDIAILEMVHEYHGVTLGHLHERFFAGKTYVACTQRTAKLEAAGYLSATRLPVLTGRGSGKAFVRLGPKGRQVVAATLGVPLSSIPRYTMPTPLHLLHHTHLVSFHLALERACAALPAVSLDDWQSEHAIKRNRTRPADGAAQELIPDASFVLVHAGTSSRCFLEIDCGTMRLAQMRRKFHSYLASQRRDGKAPIFVVTTTPQRVQQLLELAQVEAKELGANPRVFFFTTHDQVAIQPLLTAPIWTQYGQPSPVAIVPSSPTRSSVA